LTTRLQTLVSELQRLERVATEIQQRYVAHFGLHTAACLHRDPKEMAQRRDELHTILDSLLDNGESVQRVTDELLALERSIN
jgi:hypothetical protein